jgi:hypothetical protein
VPHNWGMSVINEFADVRFKVCEGGEEWYLCTLENGPATNTILHDRLSLGLLLKKGTSFEEAKTIAAYLNQHITKIAATSSK